VYISPYPGPRVWRAYPLAEGAYPHTRVHTRVWNIQGHSSMIDWYLCIFFNWPWVTPLCTLDSANSGIGRSSIHNEYTYNVSFHPRHVHGRFPASASGAAWPLQEIRLFIRGLCTSQYFLGIQHLLHCTPLLCFAINIALYIGSPTVTLCCHSTYTIGNSNIV